MTELYELSATQLHAMIRSGDCSVTDLARSCCDRIEAMEPDIRAFVHFDRVAAMKRAQSLDAAERRGPLHGIPVAIKDTIDVTGFICSWGSRVHAHRIPAHDAQVVQHLRDAGAIIIGTTVSTEYAIARAGATRNPHDLARTPGGSSSGSGAAVAAHMVPLAVGTQTLGSIVRPSTYCGIYGYKPTVGTLGTDGAMPLSPLFDTIGPMARCLDDIHLFNKALSIATSAGRDPLPAAAVPILLIEGPYRDRIEPDTAVALQDAATILRAAGHQVATHELPHRFNALTECFEAIVFRDMATTHGRDRDAHGDIISDRFREIVDRGRTVSEAQYRAALADRQFFREYLDTALGECGIVLAPATDGVAPPYSERTGDQRIQSLWSVVGYPALAVPGRPVDGLPIGIQLAAKRGHDAAILATARVLEAGLGRRDVSTDPGALQSVRS